MSNNNGVSFETVVIFTSVIPFFTPMMLTTVSIVKMEIRKIPFDIDLVSAGKKFPNVFTSALATAEAAINDEPKTKMLVVRNPKYFPKAASMYAYAPPVTVTRLPTSAKQSMIMMIRNPQNKYARIPAAPSLSLTIAGNTKIPEPITTLTILEVSPHKPMSRFNPSSEFIADFLVLMK
jgi:hypothetical protein